LKDVKEVLCWRLWKKVFDTRRQRALYRCCGGLSDAFLKRTLKLKPSDLHRQFSESFQELNKRTHFRPDTVLTDADEI
jgi:hypothetical protein